MCTAENRPMREKECRNRNLMRLSEQSSELVSVFKEASIVFIFISLLTRKAKILTNICACHPVPFSDTGKPYDFASGDSVNRATVLLLCFWKT
jgi:hypothetical protein